jgi:hypothetical protein
MAHQVVVLLVLELEKVLLNVLVQKVILIMEQILNVKNVMYNVNLAQITPTHVILVLVIE